MLSNAVSAHQKRNPGGLALWLNADQLLASIPRPVLEELTELLIDHLNDRDAPLEDLSPRKIASVMNPTVLAIRTTPNTTPQSRFFVVRAECESGNQGQATPLLIPGSRGLQVRFGTMLRATVRMPLLLC